MMPPKISAARDADDEQNQDHRGYEQYPAESATRSRFPCETSRHLALLTFSKIDNYPVTFHCGSSVRSTRQSSAPFHRRRRTASPILIALDSRRIWPRGSWAIAYPRSRTLNGDIASSAAAAKLSFRFAVSRRVAIAASCALLNDSKCVRADLTFARSCAGERLCTAAPS